MLGAGTGGMRAGGHEQARITPECESALNSHGRKSRAHILRVCANLSSWLSLRDLHLRKMQTDPEPLFTRNEILCNAHFPYKLSIKHISMFISNLFRSNLMFYLYFPPSSHLLYVCFCPVGISLL
jgi:hypothetical protein